MSDKIGMFTGSFDPLTNGHLDIIQRASALFGTLYVGIFSNPKKVSLLSNEERLRLVQLVFKDTPNIKVFLAEEQLVTSIARDSGVTHLVRGLRNAADLEYEASFDYFNRQLAPEIETIYLMAKPENRYVSSSSVRELLRFKQDISPYVPPIIDKEMKKNEKK